jgi:hypothetical protein
MQSLVAQEGKTGTHRVGAKVEDTKIVEGKVVAMAVALTLLSKAEPLIHTLVGGWAEQVAPGVAMGLEEQTIRMLALMVLLVRREGRTLTNKVDLATSSSMETGNSTSSS